MIDSARAMRDAVNQPYCLVVSSCDAYADCWLPFFTLLAKYWHPLDRAVYLNTETRAFASPHIDICCPRVGVASSRDLAWSDRLLRCLDHIPYEIVLYLQEDYFIKDLVDVAMIDECVDLMAREEIGHISLAQYRRPARRSQYRFLSEIDRRAEYRVSTQAGLWNVSALRSCLRRHETVWEFEWYGTRRARRNREAFFCVNKEYEAVHGKKVMPYDPTGVVNGRWVREVVEDLFTTHDIAVDFAPRGFTDESDDVSDRRPILVRGARRLRSSF
jgi:hypothetical protein